MTTASGIARTIFGRWLALAAAALLVLAGGTLYGSYSHRWGPPVDLQAAGARLGTMPRQIGSWTLTEEFPMEKSAIEMLECAGYVNRRYVHQDTGQTIHVAVIVGPPGPTAVHTPEICFSSRAYERQGERQSVRVEASPSKRHSFWCLDFTTRNAFAEGLRVYYAWSRGKRWEASESPRFEFAAAPLLYKIQLAAPISPLADEESPDVGRDFLEELAKSGWTPAAPQ